MSLIKQPSEIQEKKNLVMMIYGSPGDGKTTLALSAPNPVLIDTDGGVSRTHTSHRCPTVQVTKWEDVNGAMDEIASANFNTILVDTVGKLLDYMAEFIIRNNPKMRKFDGSLSLQGYGVRKQMFREFIKRCMMMGRNVVFIAHADESKVGDDIKVEPIIGGSSANDLMTEIDMVGYLTNIGGKRILFWGNDGSGLAKQIVTKNTCFLPNAMEVPQVADAVGNITRQNDFLAEVIARYEDSQKNKEKMNAEYGELVGKATERIKAAENEGDINKLLAEIGGKDFGHIYDSKMVLGRALNEKAATLGLKYSKVDAKYVKA